MTAAGGAPAAPAGGTTMTNAELTSSDFAAIAAIMQSDARISLSAGKMTLVQSRLAKRLRQHGLAHFRDYVAMVQSDETERASMVVALTTNHTHFFREVHHFDHFRKVVLPELKQRAAKGHPIRIWSAGCSSGEEVYSITMCLLGPDRASASWLRHADVRLLATDLSPPVVEATRRAVYDAATVRPIPAEYRSTWMRQDGEDYVMVDEARALVTAKVLNLFEPWPLRQLYDVIFCRNVMIYFDEEAKAELEERFVDQLAPAGHLYIGHSERLIGVSATKMRSSGQTIYAKIEGRS
ncbi:protein-glutamate O-methyltransferase CheR [Sphingomonas sp. TF3]|nr:protein-glutamate O-methyltransferase CheR [Sphingomonas sp. TF3]